MITRDQFIKSMLGTGLAASPLSSAQQPATKKGKTTVERTDVISVRAGAVAKIDAWSHAIPRPYLDRLTVLPAGPHSAVVKLILSVPALSDMDHRFRTMDRFGNYTQVLTPVGNM